MNALSTRNPVKARIWRAALGGALIGALLANALPPALGAAGEVVRTAVQSADADPGAAAAGEWRPRLLVWQPRPLPRDWRWSPRGVQFDHMFRQRR